MSHLINSPTFIGNVTINTGGLILPASYGITIPTGAPGVTTDKLYNNAGVLTFNGSALGGGSVTLTDDTTTNATYYPVMATTAGGSTLKTSSVDMMFNPSTGRLTIGELTIAGTGTPVAMTNAEIYAYDTYAGAMQVVVQNISANIAASSDFVATSDNGTDTTNYINMGINSSGYSVGTWTINGGVDGYLYTQSSNLAIGTATSATNIVLFTGGTLAANARLTIGDSIATFATQVYMNVSLGVGAPGGGEGNGTYNYAGTTQTSILSSSIIDSGSLASPGLANLFLHKHSTVTPVILATALSNTASTSHASIALSQDILTIVALAAVGTTNAYYPFGSITFGSDTTGTLSTTSAPGRIKFLTTPNGSATPTLALTINSDQTATFASSVSVTGLTLSSSTLGITIPTGAPTSTTGKLYQVSNTLYFNGSAIGGGSVTLTDDNATNATYYPVVATTAGGSTLKTASTKISFNPSTGTLTSTILALPTAGKITYNSIAIFQSAGTNNYFYNQAGNTTLTGNNNLGNGYLSLRDITTGIHNHTYGHQTLTFLTTGNYNVAIGSFALQNLTTANYNTAVGTAALQALKNGTNNTAVGYNAMYANAYGSNNTIYGHTAAQLLAAIGGNIVSVQNDGSNAALVTTQTPHGLTGSVSILVQGTGIYDASWGAVVLNTTQFVLSAATFTTTATGNWIDATRKATNNIIIGYNAGSGMLGGSGNTIIGNGGNYAAYGASGLFDNYIFICNGAGIKAYFDSTAWIMAGGMTLISGGLTLNSATKGIVLTSGTPTVTTNALYQDTGILYFDGVAIGGGMTNPMTTLGDMVYGGAAGAATALTGPTVNGTYSLTSIPTASVAVAPTWVLATGTGSPVYASTPTLITPVLGVATATSINKLTITAPATSATLTLVTGSTLATTGAFVITLNSTATSTVTFPASTSAVMNYYTAAPSTYALPYAGAASGLLTYIAPPTTNGTYVLSSAVVASAAVSPTWVLASSLGEPALGNPGVSGYMLTSTTGGVRSWVAVPGAGTGSPGGSNTYIQYNASNLFAGSANFTYDSATNTLSLLGTDADIVVKAITNEPAAPASGNLLIYAKSVAGRMVLKWIGPAGIDSMAQPHIGQDKISNWSPPGNATTVSNLFGGAVAFTAVGNATARNVATTNMATRTKRLGYVTAATTAGSLVSIRTATAQYTLGAPGSGVPNQGGFFMVIRFVPSDAATVSGARFFAGMWSATTAPTNVEPSSLTNAIGIAQVSGSANLNIVYGGSAAQTAIDLGSGFPANTLSTCLYEFILFAPPNANNTVYYRLNRLDTNTFAEGTLTAGTPGTQLPSNTTLLSGPVVWKCNNATALAVGFDLVSCYIGTDQ